ncbi:ABC transporter permease [Sedimentibacter sp. MB31-C6]|uniref:ABC transporter permease n=1 Tax=Sedimentibacter sp. MB31-C6 TaxID=3109366 RepID=UPI002DDD979A|nr:ABC transporter permease [Sedimentibacter sp. MB36-C1]WSI04832.1 ABC transporter permease [Sedimentibacter sp. MB36-C1]
MSNLLYPKLAFTNIKNNKKIYYPYILTCICTIVMFYIMKAMSINEGLDTMSGGSSVKEILNVGTYVIGIFSIIFLFYTNSFLIKRRKKELGLYNILGMDKKHIAKMLFFETFLTFVISTIIGLVGGLITSKLMFLVLLKILKFPVVLKFSISIPSLLITLILFLVIFIVILLYNLFQIHLSNPVELMRGGELGEKEPKTKIILTVIGVITIGIGYYIAITTESPLKAINLFFIAVILVIIGTYSLFTAGSIALLKILRKNKNYYYKTNHFTAVSGMIYRMKQNAVGLSNICILSTAVLVMISTTISLYLGVEDVLSNFIPKDVLITSYNSSKEDGEMISKIAKEEAVNNNLKVEDSLGFYYIQTSYIKDGSDFQIIYDNSYFTNNMKHVYTITAEEYNKLEKKSISLEENEVLIYSPNDEFDYKNINLGSQKFKIKNKLKKLKIGDFFNNTINDVYYIVVSSENIAQKLFNEANNEIDMKGLTYCFGYDVEGKDEDLSTTIYSINERTDAFVESRYQYKEKFYYLYGGMFFLGIFLGALFLMATVLIIYYKQISEGYEDKERYNIMQKVGMSLKEVKKSIQSQVLLVFFLPIVFAVIHIAAAFKMITRLLSLFNLYNVKLFLNCTIVTVLIFILFYTLVYILTAREYYKIVR